MIKILSGLPATIFEHTFEQSGGTKMQFDHTYQIARTTPMEALAEAWGMCEACATICADGKRPMTIREAGALAELHGLKLLDVLTV